MKKQFLFGLLAAGLLTACSSDDSQIKGNMENAYNLVEGEPAYLSLGIAMPAEPSTRANEDFKDGDADEYEVKSGKLFIFKGASEASSVLFKAYDIPTSVAFSNDGAEQITSSANKFVQEIDAPDLSATDKLFAYVMLNSTGNATGLTYTEGTTTWENFNAQVLKVIGLASAAEEAAGQGAIGSNGLVMTNVPLCTEAGGTVASTGDIVTLAEIDKTAIFSTAEAAEASTKSTCIYVERAAAKVTVKLNSAVKDLNSKAVKLEGWALGNVNSSATGYYNTRQVESSWNALCNLDPSVPNTTKYRFVCANALLPMVPGTSVHNQRFRTYFGKDVNYKDKTGLINGEITDYVYNNGDDTYTYENTFDEDNQKYANTTFAGIKMSLNNSSTFYTIGGDNKTMYEDVNAAKAKLVENIAAQATPAISDIITTITAKIAAALSDATSELRTACAATDVITYTLTPVVNLGTKTAATSTYDAYTANLAFKEIKVNGTAVALDGAVATAINNLEYATSVKVSDKLAANLTFTREAVTEYENGITYYAVRISHFGNAETPWSAPAVAANDYDKIYPLDGQSLHATPKNYGASRAAAWLGRWGVVRNNWYELDITSINAVGSVLPVDYSDTTTGGPTPPPGSTTDDDVEKFYISAHIHILPWVLRKQAVDLK